MYLSNSAHPFLTNNAMGGPPGPGVMGDYGAMASQFMTGGQMAYMPQTQYLSGHQYGAFRSTPQQFHQPYMQQPTMFQAYLQANLGHLPLFGNYAINIYNPGVDQMTQQMMAHRRLSDMGGALTSTGISMLPALAGLAMTGPMGMVAGLGLGLLAPDMASPYMDRLRTSREIQNMSMTRIAGGSDMSGLGRGFTLGASRGVDRHLRHLSASDAVFKQEDYREFMRMGIEHGQFDYSINADQYKTRLSQMSKEVRAFMRMYETSDIKEVFQEMERMQLMGASSGQYSGLALHNRTSARMQGLSIQEAISTYGQSGSLIFSQLGLTPFQGSAEAMGTAARITMAQRMGLVGPGQVARMGGVGGATEQITEGVGGMALDFMKFAAPFLVGSDISNIDPANLKRLMNGEVGINDIIGAAGSMNFLDHARLQFNQSNLLEQLGNQVGEGGLNRLMFNHTRHLAQMMGGDVDLNQKAIIRGKTGWNDDMVNTFILENGEEAQKADKLQRQLAARMDAINLETEEKFFDSKMRKMFLALNQTMNAFGEFSTNIVSKLPGMGFNNSREFRESLLTADLIDRLGVPDERRSQLVRNASRSRTLNTIGMTDWFQGYESAQITHGSAYTVGRALSDSSGDYRALDSIVEGGSALNLLTRNAVSGIAKAAFGPARNSSITDVGKLLLTPENLRHWIIQSGEVSDADEVDDHVRRIMEDPASRNAIIAALHLEARGDEKNVGLLNRVFQNSSQILEKWRNTVGAELADHMDNIKGDVRKNLSTFLHGGGFNSNYDKELLEPLFQEVLLNGRASMDQYAVGGLIGQEFNSEQLARVKELLTNIGVEDSDLDRAAAALSSGNNYFLRFLEEKNISFDQKWLNAGFRAHIGSARPIESRLGLGDNLQGNIENLLADYIHTNDMLDKNIPLFKPLDEDSFSLLYKTIQSALPDEDERREDQELRRDANIINRKLADVLDYLKGILGGTGESINMSAARDPLYYGNLHDVTRTLITGTGR